MAISQHVRIEGPTGKAQNARHQAWSNRTLFLALALALAAPVVHADAPAPRMTGESLLKRLQPVDPAEIPNGGEAPGKLTKQDLASLRTISNLEFVQGYLDALYDATEGKSWCYDAKSKTPKADAFLDESKWGLHRLPAAQLKRNAADLLVDIWRAKWPCPPGRGSRK